MWDVQRHKDMFDVVMDMIFRASGLECCQGPFYKHAFFSSWFIKPIGIKR